MDEKQRRISRVITIDEIINPPGGYRGSGGTSSKATLDLDSVNPGASNSFLRINHSQVVYTPGSAKTATTVTGIQEHDSAVLSGVSVGGIGNRKHVSFGSISSSTTNPSVRVYREQYWNWSCVSSNWSKRERRLLLAVGILGCIILGLVAFISVYSRKHKFGSSISDSWLGWTF